MLAIKKYIMNGEIRQLNPDWEAAQIANFKDTMQSDTGNGMRASFAFYPFVNRSTALPIVSYPNQVNLFELDSDDDSESDNDSSDDDEVEDKTVKKNGTVAIVKPTEEYEEAIQDYQSQWQLQALQEYENLAALQEYEDIMKSGSFVVNHNSALDRQMQLELEQILERYEIPGGMLSKLMSLEDYGIAEIIVDGVTRYHNAADGLVPWRERPEHFRKNCIARIPPLEP